MPKYYEDKDEDTRACAGIREDFKACLLQHDCVVKVRRRMLTERSGTKLQKQSRHDFLQYDIREITAAEINQPETLC